MQKGTILTAERGGIRTTTRVRFFSSLLISQVQNVASHLEKTRIMAGSSTTSLSLKRVGHGTSGTTEVRSREKGMSFI